MNNRTFTRLALNCSDSYVHAPIVELMRVRRIDAPSLMAGRRALGARYSIHTFAPGTMCHVCCECPLRPLNLRIVPGKAAPSPVYLLPPFLP